MYMTNPPPLNTLVIVTIFAAAILIAGSFFAGMLLNPSIPGSNQKTLNATGTATDTFAPDKVDIILSITTTNDSAQISQSDNATISDNVYKALHNMGITNSEIKTLSYYENPQYIWNYSNNRQDVNGYQTVNTIQITLTKLDLAGNVIDTAVQAGANSVQSVSFGLTDDKQDIAKAQVLQEATASAKLKASSMAAGLGISLGNVISISESNYNYYPMYAKDVAISSGSMGTPETQITAGDIIVSATVTVTFQIDQ